MNVKSLLLTAFALLITITFSIAQITPPKYYRKIVLDGKNNIVGRYEITDSVAQSSTCYQFLYNDKGRLLHIKYLRDGKFLLPDPYFNAAQIIYRYYDEKQIEKRSFFNEKNKPVLNSSGVHSYRVKLDADKNPVAQFNYNRADVLSNDINGVAQYKFITDSQGRRIRSMRFDVNGRRIIDNKGIYELSYKYDSNNNVSEMRIFGSLGELIETADEYSIVKWKYDKMGNEIEMTFYGKNEALKNNAYKYAKVTFEYDVNGNRVKESFFDALDRPVENNNNYAVTSWEYDKSGNPTKQTHLGIYNQLREYSGAAITVWVYDEKKVIVKLFGTDGLPKRTAKSNFSKF